MNKGLTTWRELEAAEEIPKRARKAPKTEELMQRIKRFREKKAAERKRAGRTK